MAEEKISRQNTEGVTITMKRITKHIDAQGDPQELMLKACATKKKINAMKRPKVKGGKGLFFCQVCGNQGMELLPKVTTNHGVKKEAGVGLRKIQRNGNRRGCRA